ncbi:MAG: HD domain-containing protein [Leptospiraceae bacterium]|nr:HD domain-containing protein [Leptospiraceae bacterium]MDW7975723.1 HD domain-containing phosphohydrolase [Leptospiraceae bacterium]
MVYYIKMATSKRKVIKIEQLKSGMSFTAPVYIDENNVLVRAYETIKKSDIEKLLKWGIDKVYTDGEEVSVVEEKVQLPQGGAKDLENVKISKEFEKAKEYRDEFQKQVFEIGKKLQKNIRSLVERKHFNNHEVLSDALYLAGVVMDYRFFPILLLGIRISDDILIQHSIHAALYGGYLGKLINLGKIRVHELIFSMMIMDVGMFFIPIELRKKNYPLTEEEKKIFYNHTLFGFKVLTQDAYVKQNLAIVSLQHHENFDGTGYPKKLQKEDINLMARIAAIADRYTAMLEDRYHRKARIPYEAMKILLSEEASHLDPRILRFMVGGLSIYPIGSLVELSNGFKAIVVEGNLKSPLRPLVKLVFDPKGKHIEENYFLDLAKEHQITVIKVLDAKEENIDILSLM